MRGGGEGRGVTDCIGFCQFVRQFVVEPLLTRPGGGEVVWVQCTDAYGGEWGVWGSLLPSSVAESGLFVTVLPFLLPPPSSSLLLPPPPPPPSYTHPPLIPVFFREVRLN